LTCAGWINHDGEGTAEEEVCDSEEEDSDGNSLSGKSPACAYQNEIVSGWRRTPLVGRVYASKLGIGYSSYHFDPNDPGFPAEHPYMNCTSAAEPLGMRPRSLRGSRFARSARAGGASRPGLSLQGLHFGRRGTRAAPGDAIPAERASRPTCALSAPRRSS
jgi:hypothetical protein